MNLDTADFLFTAGVILLVACLAVALIAGVCWLAAWAIDRALDLFDIAADELGGTDYQMVAPDYGVDVHSMQENAGGKKP